jgi:hypothetical protein
VVIVYGAVRSGTTMFRLMLGGHPDLVEIGEKRYLLWYSRFRGDGTLTFDHRDLFVDRVFVKRGFEQRPDLDGLDMADDLVAQGKQGRAGPAVITFHAELPKILRMFPGCRVLHITRDPRDVAASALRFGWAGNAYFAADYWLDAERDLERARGDLAEGQLLSLKYEDLVSEPETELRRVCAFLGIEYDEGLFGYAEHTSYSRPDRSGIQAWRKRMPPRDVRLIEARCGALMTERGYARVTEDAGPLSRRELAYLKAENRLRKLRSDVATFGAVNVVGAKVASQLGLLGMRDHFNRRKDDIKNAALK